MLKLIAHFSAFLLALPFSANAAKPAAKSKNRANEEAPPKAERASKPERDAARQEPSQSVDEQEDEESPIRPSKRNAKKGPAPRAVPKIQTQHRNFQAKPHPTIAGAQFNPNYRIAASQDWIGPQYEIFRSYQPQWHDQAWYGSRYGDKLRLIAGGWYFWEGGYWFPAWGYDESASYYPYDGPIYVGADPRPFDQVVADVQAALKEKGFYRGEIDGLIGPLTRQALAAFQSAQNLPPTAALDQPSLDSLGLGL
jgi:hypothetical protein